MTKTNAELREEIQIVIDNMNNHDPYDRIATACMKTALEHIPEDEGESDMPEVMYHTKVEGKTIWSFKPIWNNLLDTQYNYTNKFANDLRKEMEG